MAKIKKIQSGAKSSFVWMGTCDDGEDCQDFDLTSYADGQANEGVISSVFQMGDDNVAGVWKSNQPGFINDLNDGSTDNNKMLCGKNYFIKLHPATSVADELEVEIPGAIFDYKGQVGKGKVFNKDSTRPQFLGDVSNLPSCIAKGEFRNLITKAEDGTDYATSQIITPDKDGIYVKGDGSVHRIFSGKPFSIPAGSKLFKGKFGTLDTDGDGVPDEHDTQPAESDRDAVGGSSSGGQIGPTDQDSLLESFKITLPNRSWTDLEFFYDPISRKYNNKESNFNDWYIALDSSSNTWKTYLVYNNVPTEADEISASINILNTNTGITISDPVYFEVALPKSFLVTGGNIDNNAEGTYTLVFNSNSDFYYTNNNSSVEYQMRYDYDTKNWKSFSINPIDGSSTFNKNVTDPGVKFLTEIVANEVIEMGSDLQRTYLNPVYSSKAQTQDETIIFNGRSQMTSDWTADSFVMPDCAKSLSQSYQFIPDSTGDFNLQRKQVAAYYPVPPRNRSEFHKELAPSIHLSTFGIPLGFGNWDNSNFTTNPSNYQTKSPETEDLCPAPYGRNKMRFQITFKNIIPPSTIPLEITHVLDFAWDHYYKRYTARDITNTTNQNNNTPFASRGVGIGAVSQYETLIIPSAMSNSARSFWGWHVGNEGNAGTSVTWSTLPPIESRGTIYAKVLADTWFPSHAGNLPSAFWGSFGPNYSSDLKVIIDRITELSDHATYSAEDDYLDPLCLTEQEIIELYGLAGGFVVTGSSYAGVYGPVSGNTVDGLPVYYKNGVKQSGNPAFFAQTYPSGGTIVWRFKALSNSIPDGHTTSSNIGFNASSTNVSRESKPWDYDNWSFGMDLTPTDGLTPIY